MTTTNNPFTDLALMYVRGELTGETLTSFEKQLKQDPLLQQEVNDYSSIRTSYASVSSEIPEPSPDGFSKIMARIESEKVSTSPNKGTPVFSEICKRISTIFKMPAPAWGLVAAQLAVIIVLVFSGPGETTFQTLSAGEGASTTHTGISLNVIFQDSARHQDITALLTEMNASIIKGPAANGLYVIQIQEKTAKEAVMARLRKTPEIKFVQVKY